MNTIYVDTTNWDMTLDSFGNIAMASDPYSLAQDAASAIKTFLGECYFNNALGVPYFGGILGQGVPIELMRAQFVAAALTVPEVVAAQVFFTGFTNRVVTGQVQITTATGRVSYIGF